jgi:hypothetical protein
VKVIEGTGAEAVIPLRKGRRELRAYDASPYKLRNLAERFTNRVEHCRRIATRYDKTDRNSSAFWHFACVTVLPRGMSTRPQTLKRKIIFRGEEEDFGEVEGVGVVSSC